MLKFLMQNNIAVIMPKIRILFKLICCDMNQKLVILTYLIGHNNPINGFRPAATPPSRRLCFLRTYGSWLHQSMTGLPQIGTSNEYKVVLFANFRRSLHQIPISPDHPPPYERYGRAHVVILRTNICPREL